MVDFEQYARDKAEVKSKAASEIAELIDEVEGKLGEIMALAELAEIEVNLNGIMNAVRDIDSNWNSSSYHC